MLIVLCVLIAKSITCRTNLAGFLFFLPVDVTATEVALYLHRDAEQRSFSSMLWLSRHRFTTSAQQ